MSSGPDWGALWYEITHPHFTAKFVRYFFVGGFSAITDWVLFWLLTFPIGLHYLVAGALSFLIATLVNYGLSLRFVFEGGRHRRHVEATLVFLVSSMGMVINLSALYLVIEFLAIHTMIAKVIATGVAFMWNFLARYLWVFHRSELAPPQRPSDD